MYFLQHGAVLLGPVHAVSGNGQSGSPATRQPPGPQSKNFGESCGLKFFIFSLAGWPFGPVWVWRTTVPAVIQPTLAFQAEKQLCAIVLLLFYPIKLVVIIFQLIKLIQKTKIEKDSNMFTSILKKDQNTQTVKKSTFVIGEYKNNLQIIQHVCFQLSKKAWTHFWRTIFQSSKLTGQQW